MQFFRLHLALKVEFFEAELVLAQENSTHPQHGPTVNLTALEKKRLKNYSLRVFPLPTHLQQKLFFSMFSYVKVNFLVRTT